MEFLALLHVIKLVTLLEDAYKMTTFFCQKNQNSDKTVGLNNSAARAKVMQRLIVFRKVDTW